ncbi:MAG: amidohydrolase family protein [Sphingomonadaceae bacterium]
MRRLLLALALLAALPAAAQERLAIAGGRVVTNVGAPVEGGTVLVAGGRVERVLPAGQPVPPGYTRVDAAGKWVTPGIIAGISQIAAVEVNAVESTNETVARNAPTSAALNLAAGLDFSETNIPVSRIEGVTAAVTAPFPGRTIFAGQGAIVSLAEGETRPLRARAFQHVAYGELGARIAGGSRPAAWAEILNALEEARRIQTGVVSPMRDQHRDLRVSRDDAEALVPVLAGTMPLLVRVNRAADIRQVLTLRQSYPGIRLVLVEAAEGWMVANEIAAANVPVIMLGIENLPRQFETLGSTMSAVGRLVAAGVRVALGTPDLDASFQPRLLPQYAGNLVAQGRLPGGTGLSWDQAFATITRAPADIFGLADMGRIAPGARADLVIWSDDPLEFRGKAEAVYIGGRPQPMESRQTRLARRYFPGQSEDLPPAYRR